MTIKNGELADADEVMNALGSLFNDTAQNIFNADYIGFDSKLSNTGVPQLKNVFYSTFQSDDADVSTGFNYWSTIDAYVLNLTDESSGDSTYDPDSFRNPTYAFDGDLDTYACKDFTSTASRTVSLGKTFASKDVDCVYFKAYGYASSVFNAATAKLQSYNGAAWADVPGATISLENGVAGEGYFEINETAIEGLKVVVVVNSSDGNSNLSLCVYELEYGDGATTGTLIFKDTVASTSNAIPVINSTIDATSSEQISISADGGSNWTDVNNAEIARPTAGTALWRRIVISRTDLSKEDKVTEQAVKYNLY